MADESDLIQASLIYIEHDKEGNVTAFRTEADLETDTEFENLVRKDPELSKKFVRRSELGLEPLMAGIDKDVWDYRCEFTPFPRGWNPSSCQPNPANRCPGACNLRSKGMWNGTVYWCTCDGMGTEG